MGTVEYLTLSDGARLAYTVSGSGAPLVILHSGWGWSLSEYDAQVSCFESHYRVYRVDRRGYGRSTHVESLGAAQTFHQRNADEMLHWMDALGLSSAILWGHSDGATIATLMALRAAERVRALIFEGGHFYRYKSVAQEFFLRARDEPYTFSPNAIRILAAEHGEDYWARLLSMQSSVWLDFQHLGGDVYDGRLSELRLPVMVLHGERDPYTPVAEIETLAGQIPGAQLVVYPEGGHSPHNQPGLIEAVNEQVIQFLNVTN